MVRTFLLMLLGLLWWNRAGVTPVRLLRFQNTILVLFFLVLLLLLLLLIDL
jgi:hypothetical protein